MSTEFGNEKTCFSPSAASAGGFPTMVRDIRLGCLPSLSPAWRISPGSIIFRGFGIRFDNTFLLLPHGLFFSFAFCFRVHVSISTRTGFSAGLQEQSVQEEADTFSVLAHSFSPFVSHFDTHFYTSVTAPCSAGVHKATVHICIQQPRSQSSWLGLPLRSLCCAIHPLSRLHGALLRKPRNFILLASSNFILLHPGTQHHRVTPSSGLRLRPWL